MDCLISKDYKVFMYYPLPIDVDVEHQNFDFFVEYDGETYAGSAFSLKNIEFLMKKEEVKFFCSRHWICLKEISLENLEAAIDEVIAFDEIGDYFCLQRVGE